MITSHNIINYALGLATLYFEAFSTILKTESAMYAGKKTALTYEGDSISKLQIVIEKNRMEIMTYKQHLFFNIISIQI